MDSDMIKEFLVGLGFKVDAQGLKLFAGTIENCTRAAIALGVGVTAAATATVAAVGKVSEEFEDLYYASQRIKASVGNIQSYDFAIGQVGGSADAALGSLEGIASFIRSNPGAEKFIQSIGVSTRDGNNQLRDTTKIMEDLGKTFRGMPFYRAKVYANILGIDEKTLMAMIRGIDQFKDKYNQLYAQAGIDPDKAAKQATLFMNRLRDLGAQAGILGVVFAERLAPAANFFIDVAERAIDVLIKLDRLTGGLSTDFIAVAVAMGIASKAAKLLGLDLIGLIGKAIAPLLLQLAVLTAEVLPALGDAILGVAAAIEAGGIIAFGWIAIIIAAIVALAAAAAYLWNHWKDIGPFFGKMWDGIKAFFKFAADAIGEYLKDVDGGRLLRMWQGVKEFFAGLWDGITAEFKAGAQAAVHWLQTVDGGKLWDSWEGLKSRFAGLWDGITAEFKAGWDKIRPSVEAMAKIAKRDWIGALGAVAGAVVGFVVAGPAGAVAGAVAGGAIATAATSPEGRKDLANAGHGFQKAIDAARAGDGKAFGAGLAQSTDALLGIAKKAGSGLAGTGAAVMDFFTKAGWTPAQAAGITANLAQESGFNPNAIGDGGRAAGIGQWHKDRQDAFKAFAGFDIHDPRATLEKQLEFVNYELTQGTERMAGKILKGTKDAFGSGAVVSRYYERPGDVAGEQARRGAAAQDWFTRASLQPSPSSTKTIHATVSAKADIHVHGATKPEETGKAVADVRLPRLEIGRAGDAVRNLKGAVR